MRNVKESSFMEKMRSVKFKVGQVVKHRAFSDCCS